MESCCGIVQQRRVDVIEDTDLPEAADLTLTLFDLLGRTVRELASGRRPAGTYEVSFDADGLPSGVYFYRLHAGDFVETGRMVVVK